MLQVDKRNEFPLSVVVDQNVAVQDCLLDQAADETVVEAEDTLVVVLEAVASSFELDDPLERVVVEQLAVDKLVAVAVVALVVEVLDTIVAVADTLVVVDQLESSSFAVATYW